MSKENLVIEKNEYEKMLVDVRQKQNQLVAAELKLVGILEYINQKIKDIDTNIKAE